MATGPMHTLGPPVMLPLAPGQAAHKFVTHSMCRPHRLHPGPHHICKHLQSTQTRPTSHLGWEPHIPDVHVGTRQVRRARTLRAATSAPPVALKFTTLCAMAQSATSPGQYPQNCHLLRVIGLAHSRR
jgi:hypothetical protein